MFSLKEGFSRWAILFSVIAFLFILAVLLLVVLNPRWEVKQDSRYEEPILTLYIDTSATMFPFASEVEKILNRVTTAWPGKLYIRFFAYGVTPRKEGKEVEPYLISKGFVDSPTLFFPLQEGLTFSDQEQYYAILSDFLFRDGFKETREGASNHFYIHPNDGITSPLVSRSAVFILNRDNRILSEGNFPLWLLFYSDSPRQDLRYRISYRTPQGRPTQIKTGIVTTEDHYRETKMDLSFAEERERWIHLIVEIMGEGKNYADRVNLLPPRKKIAVQMVYFKINRDVFAIKNSLDRYQDYQVNTLYLKGGAGDETWERNEERVEAMIPKQDLFFLVDPPSKAVEWFRNKRIPFVHIPSGMGIRITPDFDYNLSPMDFLGEKSLSEARWKETVPRLQGIPLPLVPGDIAFHRSGNHSTFFLRDREMYWGIRNLFFLNDNVLEVGEESYWDIFLLNMMDFLYERTKKGEVDEVSHNFFLGEKASDFTMPHLIKVGESYHISPELDKAGVYPAPPDLPPYNYRIPFEEYFPPLPPDISFTERDRFLEFIRSVQNQPVPQVVREIAFRDLPNYIYLIVILIGLFLYLLAFKWYANRQGI